MLNTIRRACDCAAAARRDRAANVAITFALALVPLVGVVGIGVDYTAAIRARAQLQAAADSASIGSISATSAAAAAAVSMSGDGPVDAGASQAGNLFNSNIAGRADFRNVKVSTSVTKTGLTLNSSVQFSADVPTSFMKLFAKPSVTVDGTAGATTAIGGYIDFYLLLDNSPSMGVAATPAGVTTMVNNTSDQCAFACHDLSDPNNYYKLAKQLGVSMRIDVLRSAVQQLMDTAAAAEGSTSQYRVGVYTFNRTVQNVVALTSNLASAKGQANSIDLMTIPNNDPSNIPNTDYDSVMPAINQLISAPGSGTSSAPLKTLFFVTDGVTDEFSPPSSSHRVVSQFNASLCSTIKNRGVQIAVLYTTYLPLPTNDYYNQAIAPLASNIGPSLQACASPGLYFEVNQSGDMSAALQTLFRQSVTSAHLTH
jgi:Flp pilus assembly protein TadG